MSTAEAPPRPSPMIVNPLRGLPIGWPVLYYVTGERAHLPAPALVFRNHGNGVLDLVEQRPGPDAKYRTGVRHINDAKLAENPKLRDQTGAWDYVMGLLPPDDIPIFPSGMTPGSEAEQRILCLAARGDSRADIANAVGWPAKKVAELIERYESCLP
jgi:hypothetical protein